MNEKENHFGSSLPLSRFYFVIPPTYFLFLARQWENKPRGTYSLFTTEEDDGKHRVPHAGSFKIPSRSLALLVLFFLTREASRNTFGKIDKNISCLSFVYLISNANSQWLGATFKDFPFASLLSLNTESGSFDNSWLSDV